MAKKNKSQHKSAQKSETKNSAHITKISAKTTPEESKRDIKAPKKPEAKKSKKHDEPVEKPLRQVFILARPFVAIGRYLRDSWRELRLVRWPSRGNTWKMTLAVLAYCAIFIIFITLIDSLFTFIFNILLGQQ